MSVGIFNQLRGVGCEVSACGSRITNRPIPTGADADFLVLAPTMLSRWRAKRIIRAAGFHAEGVGTYGPGVFISYRLGGLNLIYTGDRKFARRHEVATAVCTALNLPVKADRVMIFQAVLYGEAKRS